MFTVRPRALKATGEMVKDLIPVLDRTARVERARSGGRRSACTRRPARSWAAAGGWPTPDQWDDLVRELCRIPNEITMPDALVSDQQWWQFEGLGIMLAGVEKVQAAYLAGPPEPD